MTISIICAMDKNNLIGGSGKLLWHIPEDMKWFKSQTIGKTVVMGRKTYESIGKALPNRKNIVISKSDFAGVSVVKSPEEIFNIGGEQEIMIIGGGSVYEYFLPYAEKLYITKINAEFEGDVWFPSINANEWIESWSKKSSDVNYSYEFNILEKSNDNKNNKR